MTSTLFTDDWHFAREGSADWSPVSLPHDAMIHEARSADAPAWAHGGYFPGGAYIYRKHWTPSFELQGKQVSLRFEGVYRHSRVLIDGTDVGGSLSGYREFEVRLDEHLQLGTTHQIDVTVDNSRTPNARWYTGSGIYRPVWLEVRDAIHIQPDGVTFVTRDTSAPAVASVSVRLVNEDAARVEVRVILARDGSAIAEVSDSTIGTEMELQLLVPDPRLWSADSPSLYDLTVTVARGGKIVDTRTSRVGLRTIEVGSQGLRVNGDSVTLRGANVHHDSGVLGAATFKDAELRRMRILKANGFNAVRSAHNAAARALIDACDEVGLYVMDELFDGWYDHKNEHDDADHFDEMWRDEARSITAKDRNSPSVIIYSVGNENGEAFTPRGRRIAHEIAAEVRLLDPTRPVTLGVNMVGATFAGLARTTTKEETNTAPKAAPDMTSTALNVISNRFGSLMKVFPRLRAADWATTELFAPFDIAGYNYGTARYEIDARLHPDRPMVGTESMPGDIAHNWALVEKLPTLIGDFMWAGWDYLGEAGGGAWAYGTRRAPYLKPYPQLTSGTGVFDITGQPGASVFLARAAWGLLDAPAITVRPLDVEPGPVAKTSWRSTDAVPSWSWRGQAGRRAELEIYSIDDEVEVIVNGRPLGRKPAGRSHGFVARFRTTYEPGSVVAIGYCHGKETARSELRSASSPLLRMRAEQDTIFADGQHLAFLHLELSDDDTTVDSAANDMITLNVEGPATLAGFGNGATASEESFGDATHSTYRGRAFAVIRSDGRVGQIHVTATSLHHGNTTVVINAENKKGATCR
jgi:hypothetical protein